MFSLKTLVPFLVIPFYATFLFVFLNNSVYAADLGLKLNKNLQSVVQDAQANQLKYVNNYHQTLILNNNELQKNKENAEVLVKDRNYESLGGKTMVINYLNNLSDEQKATIIATGVGGAVEIQGRQYFLEYVDNDDTVNTIAERETYAPEIISQLNYLYETDAWGTPSGGRVVPDDYNTTTHWNLEKIKTPESWNDLGGCQSDTLCGGDPTIKVAVIDTGVAYEDFDYDAGATYTNKKLATLGFNMEVTSGTADGEYNEGYDRRYAKSPELDNATFTDPYDAAWDVLCDYRSLESNSSDRCNAAELAKVDHANDDYGHGTFVTQIINSDTGTDAATNRIVGIAHNVQIMPIKVSYPYDRSFCFNSDGTYNSTCSNSDYDYRGAITSLALVAGIDAARINGADVVNMSLAGNGVSTLEEEAMQEALDADIILIAASGNDGTSGDNVYPAAYTGVVSVGASRSNDSRASYSNYGNTLDVVAPVGQSGDSSLVRSITYSCFLNNPDYTDDCSDESGGDNFQSFTSATSPIVGAGTSFAAPQVAAAAALYRSQFTSATREDFTVALHASAIDLSPASFDIYTGYGQLNIEDLLAQDPSAFTTNYFTWFDSYYDRFTYILIGNPSATETAFVNVKVGAEKNEFYSIEPGTSIAPTWKPLRGGPITVVSNIPVYTSQRTNLGGSFNEYPGIKASELTTKYYFTWYDTKYSDRFTYILVGNPSESQTANVNIKVGSLVDENFTIAPGESIAPIWRWIQTGPVVVTSDIDVYATQRTSIGGSFNEYAGITVP